MAVFGPLYGEAPSWAATKHFAPEPPDDKYTWIFDLATNSGDDEEDDDSSEYSCVVGFYAKPAGSWILVDSMFYSGLHEGRRVALAVDGMGAGEDFGIGIISSSGPGGGPILTGKRVEWEEATVTVDVHGFNKATDSDPTAGLTYPQEGSVTETFAPIADAPGASILASFGDRAIALQDGADPQVFCASADGDITEWAAGDSVSTTLLDTRIHPIDDLMSFVPLGANVAALIRKRSIMRSYETGNVALAVGTVHWLDGIGTDTKFSAEQVEGGAMFLGHDYMVYYITEGGIKSVGAAIQKELIRTLIGNPDGVDSAYYSVFQDFILGIPEYGASHITTLWVFDLGRFLVTEEKVWRRRSVDCHRIEAVSGVPKSSTPDPEYIEGDVATEDTIVMVDTAVIDVTVIDGLLKYFTVKSYLTVSDLLKIARAKKIADTVYLEDGIFIEVNPEGED